MSPQELKKVMYDGMISNFEEFGELTPICFFLKDGNPVAFQIPSDALSDFHTKANLADTIKAICMQPGVTAAGMIIEAYAAVFDNDDQLGEQVMKGNIRVSECNNKKDIIFMILSTPYKEEMIGHFVDPENKTVGEEMTRGLKQFSGLFSGFFKWTQN